MVKLDIINNDGSVKKTLESKPVRIKVSTIRMLLKLLKVEDIKTNDELFNKVVEIWDDLLPVLESAFPGAEPGDFDDVAIDDVVPAVIGILTESITKLNEIPGGEEKNA